MSDLAFFLDSPELWKSVAFLSAAALTICPLYSLSMKAAQRRIDKIIAQLNESEKLRKEAENLLKEAQGQNFNRAKERRKTICKTLDEVHLLESNFSAASEKEQEMHKKALSKRISLVKEANLKKIKEDVVKKTVQITDFVLEKEKAFNQKDVFFDKALDELDKVLSDKDECCNLIY